MEENKNNPQEVKVKKGWWNSKTKKNKVSFIISIILLVLAVFFMFTMAFARTFYGNEIGDKVLGEGIPNGFVKIGLAFAEGSSKIFYSLGVIIAIFVVTFFIDLIIKLSTRNGKRARTTGSLIRSLIKYAAVLVGLAVVLTIWGVNIAGIVGSLGIVTLIIGLGCQSLINDIVSGLFIVFDDYFSVGDMVIIDGFRGWVEEIGLKSVRINDRVGNVKTITNSSINTCVNLSRGDNMLAVTMEASYNEDPRRVEAIILRELPNIRKRMPMCTEGPNYLGIDSFSDAGVGYKFSCKAKTENRFQVQRDLNREIYLLFRDNGILVPYKQITVNPADPSKLPSASEEDKELVEAFFDDKRGITPKSTSKKNKKFLDKLKETFDDSVNKLEGQ